MTLFSLHHFFWLAITLLFVIGCIYMQRIPLNAAAHRWVRNTLFVMVLVNEACWFGYRHIVVQVALVKNLPLHLCDISVFIMLFTLATNKTFLAELSYYAGLVGALLAVFFPAISETGSIYTIAVIRYFITHIALVGVGCYFTYGRRYYPNKGAILRSYLAVHLYALLVTPINLILGTNYFFTLAAPKQLAFIQPYPHWLFLAVVSLIFLLSFCLLHLPFVWLQRSRL